MTPKEAWNSLLKKLVVFEFLYNSNEKKELLKNYKCLTLCYISIL